MIKGEAMRICVTSQTTKYFTFEFVLKENLAYLYCNECKFSARPVVL
jgi:hypothetical protein